MAYQYDDPLGYDPDADFDHDWVHVGCSKNSSPNRPPILNSDNFSSSEAGTPVNDPNTSPQVHALNMNMNNLHFDEHVPSSYPSSNDGSVRAPDGPEIRDPGNNFLPVAPATGLGEMQHRARASFDDVEDQLAYSIRKYLKSLPPHERSFHASCEGLQATFLPLDTHIVGPSGDSVRATRGKSSGSPSDLLGSVYSGASSGWRSSNVDPVAWSGGWIGESISGSWPMEITEEDAVEGSGD